MITIRDEEYDFKFTLKRVDMIEQATGKSMMANLINNNGMMSISDLRTIFITGLKKEDGPYIGQKHGTEAFEKLLTEEGYAGVAGMVIEALERDCPFFFQAD